MDESHASHQEGCPPGIVVPEAQRTVDKPWGREIWWALHHAYCGKRIEIIAGHALSLQYHEHKHETLYFLSGTVRLRLGHDEYTVHAGCAAVVAPGVVHRIEALTDAIIFEVSTPELDDVVRLEDRYGRVSTPAGPHAAARGAAPLRGSSPGAPFPGRVI